MLHNSLLSFLVRPELHDEERRGKGVDAFVKSQKCSSSLSGVYITVWSRLETSGRNATVSVVKLYFRVALEAVIKKPAFMSFLK